MRIGIFCCLIIFLVSLCLSGCETTKGFALGIGQGTGALAVLPSKGVAEGIKKDARTVYNSVYKTDSWIKENLW